MGFNSGFKGLTFLFLLRLFTDKTLTLHPRVSVGRDGSDLQCRAGCQAHWDQHKPPHVAVLSTNHVVMNSCFRHCKHKSTPYSHLRSLPA